MLDGVLVGGLILVIISLPAMLAAWINGAPFYPRLAIFVVGVLMVEFCYISIPDKYPPYEWGDAALRVTARIIP